MTLSKAVSAHSGEGEPLARRAVPSFAHDRSCTLTIKAWTRYKRHTPQFEQLYRYSVSMRRAPRVSQPVRHEVAPHYVRIEPLIALGGDVHGIANNSEHVLSSTDVFKEEREKLAAIARRCVVLCTTPVMIVASAFR